MDKNDITVFRNQLRKIERLLTDWANRDCMSLGVTISQCHALLNIEETGRPSLGELASQLGLDKSTLSRTVEGMVRDGLLYRESNPEDRRVTRLCLTEKGKRTCETINARNDSLFGGILERLGEKRQAVLESFTSLISVMTTQQNR